MNYLCIPLRGKRDGVSYISEAAWPLVDGIRWYLGNNGYVTSARGATLHRRLMAAEKAEHVDHFNFDRLDNRYSNLRICSQQQNNLRSRKRRTPWPYKGVRKVSANRWQARIAGKYIGSFKTAEDAARAYDTAALRFFGNEAWLNFGENK